MISDTSPLIQEKFAAMMKQKSGEERLKMGFSMFDSAMELVLSSLPASSPVSEMRKRVFMRLYGCDFNLHQSEKIVQYLQRYACVKHDLPMVIRGATKFIQDSIIKHFPPKCIILYGSWTKGTAREDSDIDLLVVYEKLNDKTKEFVRKLAYDQHIDKEVTLIPANAEDFIKEKLPLFTAVKNEGKILYGNTNLSISAEPPQIKYADFFRQSREFESGKVETARRLFKDGFYQGIPIHCFIASKHAVQAALAMRGNGYSSKVPVLLPLARECFGEDVALGLKTLFDIYTRSEYELDDVSEEEAGAAIKCAEEVLRVYKEEVGA